MVSKQSLIRFARALAFWTPVHLALFAGCADPDGAFDDFTERQKQTEANKCAQLADPGACVDPTPAAWSCPLGEPPREGCVPGADGTSFCCPGIGECVVPAAGAIDGDYFMALSAKVSRKKPLTFLAKVTTTAAGDSIAVSMSIQPLLAADRRTPVGPAIDVGPYPVAADGTMIAALPELTVAGEANPISGSQLTATITLEGRICEPADFVCGPMSGNATEPLAIDLDGSTWTMQKVTDPAMYPPALINCELAPADPLP
jgi:hypothetical protein